MPNTRYPALLLALIGSPLIDVAAAQSTPADSAARLAARADSAYATNRAEATRWSIERWLEAVSLYRQAKDLPAASRVLQRAGRAQIGLSQFQAALSSFQAALEIERLVDNSTGQAGQLANIGSVHARMGRGDSALAYLLQARSIAERVSDTVLTARLLANLAGLHASAGRADSAIAGLRAALAFAAPASDQVVHAQILVNLASNFETMGLLDSAVHYGHRAVALARKLGSAGPEATGLQNLGNTYRRLGLPDSALAYLRLSQAIRKRLGDLYGEGRTIGSIGNVFNDAGAKDSALVYLRASKDILRGVGDVPGVAQSALMLGIVYQELGLPDSALAYDQESLAILRQLRDRRNEGAVLNNLINVYVDRRQLDSAAAYGELAIAARRNARDRQGEGYTLEALSVVQARRGERDSALALLRGSLAIARETRHRMTEASRLVNISDIFGLLGRRDSALFYAGEGRRVAQEVRDPGTEAKAMQQIANLRSSTGNLAGALAAFDTAAAIRSALGRRAGADFARMTLAERNTSLFEQWSLAWADQGQSTARPLASLAATERGRAQALLDLMRDSTRGVAAGADLEAEGARLIAAATRSGAGGLFYLATRDTLLIWVASPTRGVILLRNPAARDTLSAQIGEFLTALGADGSVALLAARGGTLEGRTARPVGGAPLALAGGTLSRTLRLTESLVHLGSVREVVIVPQGPLALVPFTVLPAGSLGEPFGMSRALRYSPSLATLEQAERRPRPALARGRAPLAVVVGNPLMPEMAAAGGERGALAPLPGAEQESRAVAAQLGAEALIGARASESEVRKRLVRAPVVHLATHGFAYSAEARALASFVALAPDSVHDGALTVGELLDDPSLRLTAELVVLSACQTGLGDLKQAEGTVGLQRAFLARGARSVLVSLWNVSDEATGRLMEAFYRHWLGNSSRTSKAEALRRAQEEVRKTPGFEHPRFWAAFQLVGAS